MAAAVQLQVDIVHLVAKLGDPLAHQRVVIRIYPATLLTTRPAGFSEGGYTYR
jgi:hypothetical protein